MALHSLTFFSSKAVVLYAERLLPFKAFPGETSTRFNIGIIQCFAVAMQFFDVFSKNCTISKTFILVNFNERMNQACMKSLSVLPLKEKADNCLNSVVRFKDCIDINGRG